MSFCTVPASRVGRHALLLGDQLVEQQQDGGGGVDRHRGGHLVERDPVEQGPHVVEAVDGHPHLRHLAERHRVVGVVAHLGGEVEGHREPGLPGGEQCLEPSIGLLGGAEPGVLAHRPRPAAVHGGMRTTGERVLAGLTQAFLRVPSLEVVRPVADGDGVAAGGATILFVALRHPYHAFIGRNGMVLGKPDAA